VVKDELLKELKRRMEKKLPKKEWARSEVVECALETLIEIIKEKVLSGEEVKIREFGIFYLKPTKARTARNPKTGEKVTVPARKKFAFKASKKIRFVEA
jgi:nucleoid DNA-binding protein